MALAQQAYKNLFRYAINEYAKNNENKKYNEKYASAKDEDHCTADWELWDYVSHCYITALRADVGIGGGL